MTINSLCNYDYNNMTYSKHFTIANMIFCMICPYIIFKVKNYNNNIKFKKIFLTHQVSFIEKQFFCNNLIEKISSPVIRHTIIILVYFSLLRKSSPIFSWDHIRQHVVLKYVDVVIIWNTLLSFSIEISWYTQTDLVIF